MKLLSEQKEHPIIFQGPKIRTILDWDFDVRGDMQTRRVIKIQPENKPETEHEAGDVRFSVLHKPGKPILEKLYSPTRDSGPERMGMLYRKDYPCPYGKPGDRLWVREAWFAYTGHGAIQRGYPAKENYCEIGYMADMKDDFETTTRSSIHMPRWAARIMLEVTDVRVERVQEITDSDALAEGLPVVVPLSYDETGEGLQIASFKYLWDSINKKRGYGFDLNPWVWVISFKKVEAE